MTNESYLLAGIFETEGRLGAEARLDELRGVFTTKFGLTSVTTQEEDAAVVESPAGVAPPLLVQLVRLLSPVPSRREDLTQTRSLEASAREEAVLSMKLLLVVHGWEGTASVLVRYEDLRTGEDGVVVVVSRPVHTSSQQNS